MKECYYTIETLHSDWVVYRGEHVGYDWWNHSPIRFSSEEDAIKAISESEDYKDCSWRIVRTTIERSIVHELKVS